MKERLRALQTSVMDRWNALSRNQKIQLIAIAAVFFLVLGATLYMNLRTKLEVLVDNRDLTVVSNMRNALNDAGIKNSVVNNGRGLAVDRNRVVDAQVIVARDGLLDDAGGATGFTYLDALNFSGMGTTETIKRESMRRAKETELSSALRLFDGISKATVNLTIPDDNYFFVKPVDTARASAVLTVSRPLTKNESLQVARFLSASVKGLTLDNIEISDQNYNSVYSGLQETSGGSSSQYDMEMLRKNDIEMKIKVSLSPLFDAVTVINDNLKFNWDKIVETSDLLSSPLSGSDMGVILRASDEKHSSASSGSASPPGVPSNDQTANTYQTQNGGGASNSTDKSNSTEYGYNRTQKTMESASGALKATESTIAVMVYRNRVYEQGRMGGQLNGQTWEGFKETTQEAPLNIDFDPIKDVISKGTGLNAANISVYGYEVPVFVDMEPSAMNAQQMAMFAVLAILLILLATGVMRGMPKEVVTEVEPELSVEELLESTRMEEAKETERASLQEIELDKEPEAKKLIEKFVNERPEAVAQLLRNWLNDNWE